MFETYLFQTVQFSICTDFVYTQLNVKAILFQIIKFSISTQFSCIWPVDRTLSDGPWSNGNKREIHIPQSSSITGASPSDCLASYIGHSLGESFHIAEI